MGLENANKLNYLFTHPNMRNGLLFSEWLKKEGYSDQLLKKYRDSGWLVTLSRGIMYQSGTSPTAYKALSSYNEQLSKNFRVAAHSALELAGFNHYVPMGKPLLMVAYPKGQRKPLWMGSDVFDRTFKLFSTEIFAKVQETKMEVDGVAVQTSVPEQAFLECLSLAPQQYNYMDLYYIMEQLTTLRAGVLQELLEGTSRINVKRMFLYMAEKSGHTWFNDLDLSKIPLGVSKIQLVKKGTYISKYKITVPKELNEYD
jgi:hypothetical protein